VTREKYESDGAKGRRGHKVVGIYATIRNVKKKKIKVVMLLASSTALQCYHTT